MSNMNAFPVPAPDLQPTVQTGLIDAVPGYSSVTAPVGQVEQPLIDGPPNGITAAPNVLAEQPVNELIVGPPGTTPTAETSDTGSRTISVGPTNNLSVPILGLPKGMSLAEGHVLATQQNQAAAAQGVKPDTTAWAYPETPPASTTGATS